MANRIPCFFYAPTWDYPPGGPIKLGNVIASVKTPELPLYTTQILAEDEAYTTEKRVIEFSNEKLHEGRFSILTRFMSFLGVGVDVSPSRSKSFEEIMSFERIETTQFSPREDFFQRCIEAGPVRRFLEKSRYRKPIYIVTGLKVVTGARAKTLESKSIQGSLGLDVDGTIWSGGMVPVSGGPEISGAISRKESTSWEQSSDFVLAYRLRKVKVSKVGKVSRDEDYKTGAMLGEHDRAAMEASAPSPLEIDASGEDVGVSDGDEGFGIEETTEDGHSVLCAIPQPLD